jgi:hypothetical protein
MKLQPYLTFLVLALAGLASAAEPKATPEQTGDEPTILSPNRVEVIFLAQGRATTVQLVGKGRIQRYFLGADIVELKYDEELNQLQLVPVVDEGETNINITLGGETYVWVLKIVQDRRLQYRRTFSLEAPIESDQVNDELKLAEARPLKPFEIDIVALSKTAIRAQSDATFRGTQTSYRHEEIDKKYSWNDNVIRLVDVHQFLDLDLLLFKVEWVNRAKEAIYLNVRQYGLQVANQRIPVIVAMQAAPNAIIMPGQHETAWLAVQGYRLRRKSDWELVLPADSRAITAAQP